MARWQWLAAGLFFSSLSGLGQSFIPLQDLRPIRENYRLVGYDNLPLKKRVTVAVIANGFSSLEERIAKELQYFKNPVLILNPPATQTDEGTLLAAIIAAMAGYQEDRIRFIMVPVTAEAELIAALEPLSVEKPDIIYSGVNFPPRSESSVGLKEKVQAFLETTHALWFQSAGDEAQQTSVLAAQGLHPAGWVNFSHPQVGLSVPLQSELAFLPGKISVSWHSSVPAGAETKGLLSFRFCLYREQPGVNIEGAKTEVCSEWGAGESTASVKLDRNQGHRYLLYVQSKPQQVLPAGLQFRFHFEAFTDRKALRDGIAGPAFRWLAGSVGTPSLVSPADLTRVITVGGTHPESSVGPTWQGEPKPEMIVDRNEAIFEDGRFLRGSAVAAAYAAGVVAHLQSAEPRLATRELALTFLTYWPKAAMLRDGWEFNEALTTALIKQHPGVVRYLLPRIGGRWVGVQRTEEGLFRLATTAAPGEVAEFRERPGEKNLFFLSAPTWDLTGQSVTHAVLPQIEGKKGVVLMPSAIQLDKSVEIVFLKSPTEAPVYLFPPTPEVLFSHLGEGRWGRSSLANADYVMKSYEFPQESLAQAPNPTPPPLPAKLPEPAPKKKTGPLYLHGVKGPVSGTFTFVDPNGQQRTVRASSSGPNDKAFVADLPVPGRYEWRNDDGGWWYGAINGPEGYVHHNGIVHYVNPGGQTTSRGRRR